MDIKIDTSWLIIVFLVTCVPREGLLNFIQTRAALRLRRVKEAGA